MPNSISIIYFDKGGSMLEADYQAYLIKRIKRDVLPGSLVLKNDTQYLQGIPDLTVLHGPKWAVLEVKTSARARKRPNQEYYIDLFDGWSFAAFIYPENEEDVLNDLQFALQL